MAHFETTDNLTPQQIKCRELINKGDNFFKIEIYRYARLWYKRALETNEYTDEIKQKITLCNEKLSYEKNVITILILIALGIIGIILIF